MKTAHNNQAVRGWGVGLVKRFVYFSFLTMVITATPFFTDLSCADEAVRWRQRPDDGQSRPECALDITCSDQLVRLGFLAGVCLHADCPGVVAVLHQRSDEASFRRRFFSYRHFAFEGQFVLKDRGVLESGPVRARELFLVLPGDVIEFKIDGDDCLARIDIKNLGYIKKGSLSELQRWLAEQTFMGRPMRAAQSDARSASIGSEQAACQVRDAVSLFNQTGILEGLARLVRGLNGHPY